MPNLLIQTRTTPPRINRNIVVRDTLNGLFNKNKNCSLVLVCAPAGYGKTTFVLDYLQLSGCPFAWFSIPADGINNFNDFFSYVIHSLQNLNSGFGYKTSEHLDLLNKKSFGELNLAETLKSSVTVFINEFYEFFKEEIYLVLDDLHFIGEESVSTWLIPCMNLLVENIPVNLHLIISSREVPDLNISKLIAARNILVLGERELAFQTDEIKSLLKNIYEIEISEEELGVLSKELKGWITGIHLLIQSKEKNISEVKNFVSGGRFLTDNLYQFFAEEIFSRLDNSVKDFLVSTSILDYVEKDQADRLLSVTNSEELINEIINRNLFVQQLEAGPVNQNKYFSYHSLFRQFLNNKLSQIKTEEEIKQLYNRAASYLASKDDSVSAIKYYAKASCFSEAAEHLEASSANIINESKFDLLWELIHLIPDSIVNGNPHLLYCMSYLQNVFKGNLPLSLKYINQAISLLGKNKNPQILITYSLLKSDILSYLGEVAEAEKTLLEIEPLCSTPLMKTGYLHRMSKNLSTQQRYNEAIDCLQQALIIAGENDMEQSKINSITNLAEIYLGKGDFLLAISYFSKLEFDKTAFIKSYITSVDFAEAYSYTGEFEKAGKLIQRAEDLLSTYPGGFVQIFLMLSKSYLLFERCEFRKCIDLLNEIKPLTEKSSFRYYVYHCHKFIGLSHYYLEEYSKAQEHFDIAERLAYVKIITLDIKMHIALLNIQTGETVKLPNEEIESVLVQCVEYFSSKDLTYYTFQAAYHAGCYYLKNSSDALALKYFKVSLDSCSKNKYDSFILRELIKNSEVFDYLLKNDVQKNYILALRNWGTGILSGINDKNDGAKGAGMLYDLELKSFGVLKINLRGEDIELGKKLRTTGKLILAYLLMNPGTKYTKDKILDMFFPGIPLETLDDSFHQAISSIRKAAKLKYMDVLIYENKTLLLNPLALIFSDVLEFVNLYNKFFSEQDTDKKITAAKSFINIYTGDFMEGFYEEWVEELREEYKNKFIRLAEAFIPLIFGKNDFESSGAYSDLLLKQDPLNEAAYYYFISSYHKSGNPGFAKQAFRKMKEVFKKETGGEPPAKLLAQLDFMK